MRTLYRILMPFAAASLPAVARAQNTEAVALRAQRDSLVQLLKNMVGAQESYFSDHTRYTDSISNLGVSVHADWKIKLEVGATGWAATVSSAKIPGMECAVAVGARQNPLKPDVKEGEPICRK